MKYIKIYENIPTPRINDAVKNSIFNLCDYVVADNYIWQYKNIEVKNFLKNNVGVIKCAAANSYDVDYINIPTYIHKIIVNRIIIKNSIVFYTEDLRLATSEEIKQYELQKYMNKYNL